MTTQDTKVDWGRDTLPTSLAEIHAQALWRNRFRIPRRRALAEAGK